MKKQTLKKLKPQLDTILILIYQFRFLNTQQLQQILNKKYRNRLIEWLNYLCEEKYLRKEYSKKFASSPTTYYLDSKSKKYFETYKHEGINIKLLKRVYREKALSRKFRNHCMLNADIFISLLKLTRDGNVKVNFLTETNLLGIKYVVLPEPDAYFSIESNNNSKRYFLDIFDDLPPRMILRKRVRQYLNYYENNYWQDHNKNPFPEIILVCPDNTSKNYLSKFIKKALDNTEDLNFYLSLREDVKAKGLCKEVLSRVVGK
ncbi:replication-relaxation family protein [Patescibacteria group bacterium]|nr:replication-relaxation family protein [Patescibacteria group bacterium]